MLEVNGNGSVRFWWRAPLVMAVLAWSTWITINVANYVSGEARGERLSTVEAKLMIEIADKRLRAESITDINVLEGRIYERLRTLEDQFKIMNERFRVSELKKSGNRQ